MHNIEFNQIFIAIVIFLTLIFSKKVYAQFEDDYDIHNLQDSLQKIDFITEKLNLEIEMSKLKKYKSDLIKNGLPEIKKEDTIICYLAYCLNFDKKYKLAKWTAHIIAPEIEYGRNNRSNDFRVDSLIEGGTAVEADYFLKTINEEGKVKYDGFGYDRGHLAPSADFKWSAQALSESYFYSNMTPQLPNFNRKSWANLEAFCRDYVVNNKQEVYIVTAPVLHDSLPKIERGVNHLPIPQYHYKIMVDMDNKKGIVFFMPQETGGYPLESFVITIDSLENITKINYFPKLSYQDEQLIESNVDISLWRSGQNKYDVAPIPRKDLKRDYYNTIEARQLIDYPKDVVVCGKVVSATRSKKGHVFLNLDKSFPKQIFSATIWKTNLINFSYEPEIFFNNKTICIKGRVKDYQGVASMYPENEKNIFLFENNK